MESVVVVLALTMIAVACISVAIVMLRAAPGVRLTVKIKQPFVVPASVCVINGSEATQWQRLSKVLNLGSVLRVKCLQLPFSAEGYAAYRRAMPASVSVYKGGFSVLARIPLLGIMLAVFWVWVGALLGGALAVADLLRGKRQRIKVGHFFRHVFSHDLYGVDLYGVHERFAAEALRVNTGESLEHYLTQQRRAWPWYTYISRPQRTTFETADGKPDGLRT